MRPADTVCPLKHLENLTNPPAGGLPLAQTNAAPVVRQGLNNAVALDFDYRQQMIYWTDVTTQGSMIRRMHINGSDVQVSASASCLSKIGESEKC